MVEMGASVLVRVAVEVMVLVVRMVVVLLSSSEDIRMWMHCFTYSATGAGVTTIVTVCVTVPGARVVLAVTTCVGVVIERQEHAAERALEANFASAEGTWEELDAIAEVVDEVLV